MRRRLAAAGALFVALLGIAGAHPATAQETPVDSPAAKIAGDVLRITPAVGRITAGPGTTVTESVTVENVSGSSTSVVAASGDIIPDGAGGFQIQPAQTTGEESAAPWVTIDPATFDLGAGESAVVTVGVQVPAGTPAGGRYAGVLLSPGSLRPALHSLLIEVTGQGITRTATVAAFSMPKLEVRGRVPFRITVINTGNLHAAVRGTITVRDRLRGEETEIPVPMFFVLPNRRTTITVVWQSPPPLLLARSSITLTISFPRGIRSTRSGGSASGIVAIYWVVALLALAVVLTLRILLGLLRPRSRRARRERKQKKRAVKLPPPPPPPPPVPAPRPAQPAKPPPPPIPSRPPREAEPVARAAAAPRKPYVPDDVDADDEVAAGLWARPPVEPAVERWVERPVEPVGRPAGRAPLPPPPPARAVPAPKAAPPPGARPEPAPHRPSPMAWEEKSPVGSMALRRARTAIRMLEQGAGQSGVRVDVAMGLLRSVQAVAEVRTAVEAAYGEAIRKRSSRSAAGLALALQAVDSSEAPAALLRGYARADTVLASRLRRALMECDPADLRAQDELLEALPRSRRQALQIG